MRKVIFNLVGIAIVLGAIIAAVIYAVSDSPVAPESQEPQTPATFPSSTDTESQPIPNQPISKGTRPEIVTAFKAQSVDAASYTFGGTIIVANYALQAWRGGEMGGEALLVYDATLHEWKLQTEGGGAASVASLVSIGVPQGIAETLMAGHQ